MTSLFSKITNFFPAKVSPPPVAPSQTPTNPTNLPSTSSPLVTDSAPTTSSDTNIPNITNANAEPTNTEKKGALSTISTGASTLIHQPTQSIYKIGSFISTIANKVVEKIEDERLKLLTEQEKINITDIESAHVKPPWIDIPTSDVRVQEEVRVLILGLTRSKRNFLNAPPDDVNFPFNYNEALPVAIASLQADPRLDMARFCLVPMYLKEEMFWRNWFYRVRTIMAAYGLHLNLNKNKVDNSPGGSDTKEVEVGGSAAYLDKDLEKELSQLGVHTAESNPEAWEEELRAELESMTEKGITGSLADNWEEELRKELGIKDDLSLSLEIAKNTKETTPLSNSEPKVLKNDVGEASSREVSSKSPASSSPTKSPSLKDDILDSSSSDDDKPTDSRGHNLVETVRPDLNLDSFRSIPTDDNNARPDVNNNNNAEEQANRNNEGGYVHNNESPRSPDNAPGPDPTHDTSVTHTPSYRTSSSLHVEPDDDTIPTTPDMQPTVTTRPDAHTPTTIGSPRENVDDSAPNINTDDSAVGNADRAIDCAPDTNNSNTGTGNVDSADSSETNVANCGDTNTNNDTDNSSDSTAQVFVDKETP